MPAARDAESAATNVTIAGVRQDVGAARVLKGVIASMLLVFAIGARELVAKVLLAPIGTRTIALFIWRQFEQGSVGPGMAMSTCAIAMTVPILMRRWGTDVVM